MDPGRERRALTFLALLTVALTVAITAVFLLRSQDLARIARQDDREQVERSRERTAQLEFFCSQHNGLAKAVQEIINPPGAPALAWRVRANDLLEGTHCDPAQFHLDPP